MRIAAANPQAEASAVVDFWREAGPKRWFAKDADFDRRFREGFLSLHEAATIGDLADWLATPNAALALVLFLDQFPRNAFRGTPRMFASDAMAREVAAAAIEAGHDLAVEADLRIFFYLPFGHSEDLADQERSVALNRRLGGPGFVLCRGESAHRRRFGRFPHRNPILGRAMTRRNKGFWTKAASPVDGSDIPGVFSSASCRARVPKARYKIREHPSGACHRWIGSRVLCDYFPGIWTGVPPPADRR